MKTHTLFQEPIYCFYLIQKAQGRQKLFYKDTDYAVFRDSLKRCTESQPISLLAFACEDKQFHLILKASRSQLQNFLTHLRKDFEAQLQLLRTNSLPQLRSQCKSLILQESQALFEVIQYLHQKVSCKEKSSLEEYLQNHSWVASHSVFRRLSPEIQEARKQLFHLKSQRFIPVLQSKKWPPVLGDEMFCRAMRRAI